MAISYDCSLLLMEQLTTEIEKAFGNKLRLRVCGILTKGEAVLLAKHKNLGGEFLWSPPGGGVDFGESVYDALKREFEEETGLSVGIGEMLFVHEYLDPPLHAIELFFRVTLLEGNLSIGIDPEMPNDAQIIEDMQYLDFDYIDNIRPVNIHRSFHGHKSLISYVSQNGFLKA